MTRVSPIRIAPGVALAPESPPVIIGGPCVIEDLELCREVAETMATICGTLALPYVFKASFDKANRTSGASFRGPGMGRGLEILHHVREEFGVPVLTDVHEASQIPAVARVVDVLQIPAFLCRQTDLLTAAGESGRVVNLKKGQFMAPEDMATALKKVTSTGNRNVFLTERGTSFGYHNLVVDMRSLVIMARLGVPVVFDATHSVQLPGGQGLSSGGDRQFVPHLVRAAVAVGVHGLFLEVHPEPERALCDGPNSVPLEDMTDLLTQAKAIHEQAVQFS